MKIFVSDLDGTLLLNDGTIASSTIDEINKFTQSGNQFIIATGRNYVFVKQIKDMLGADAKVITVNGGVIIDGKSDQVEFEEKFSKTQIQEIINLTEHFGVPINLYSINNIYYFSESQRIKNFKNKNLELPLDYQISLIKINDINDIEENINKIVFTFENNEYKEEIQNLLKTNQKNCFFSADILLDVMPNGINKGSAIGYLKKTYKDAKIYVAGDGDNDIEMLSKADVAIVMDNAKDSIKKYADIVADSNENKGLEKILKELNQEE